MKHIAIIGNGISGITAARHIRKRSSEHRITVISAESDHFYSRTALMYIYMGHMKYENTKPYEDWFWKKNRIDLVKKYVAEVKFEEKTLQFDDGSFLAYDELILAVGSKSNKFGWPGQDLKGVQGLYHLQDLEGMEHYSKDTKRAVIVGGGLIGIEMAEMFLSRNIPVTFLIREKEYWDNVLPLEEARMVSRHAVEHHLDLRKATELDAILDDGNGRVKGITTKSGETIDCQFVGLTVGVSPNIDFLKETALETQRGIMVDECMRTNIDGVYAVGDCAQYRTPPEGRRPIEPLWYTGRMHGEAVARTICEAPTPYRPGVWFNSAKFFDIEYQVYGEVRNVVQDHEEHIYWEHPKGKHSIRIIYHKTERHILGFNLMGLRFRHEVCDKWLRDKAPIETVMTHLKAANFDPEFYKRYEADVVALYNQKNPGKPVKLKRKPRLAAVLGL